MLVAVLADGEPRDDAVRADVGRLTERTADGCAEVCHDVRRFCASLRRDIARLPGDAKGQGHECCQCLADHGVLLPAGIHSFRVNRSSLFTGARKSPFNGPDKF